MTSHNPPSFTNLPDALNSATSSQGRTKSQHPKHSQGAPSTHAAGPSSASASRSNPVNGAPSISLAQLNENVNKLNNVLTPGSSVSLEALLHLSQSISQQRQLAAPVGTQEDDQLLVRTLYESDDNGQTYRQALENLNGVCQLSSVPGIITTSHHCFLGPWAYRSTMEGLFP